MMTRPVENGRTGQMSTYEIEQYEVHTQIYRVNAHSEADALRLLFDGQADAVDNGLEFIEVCEDLGLPVDDNQELADQLRSLGVPLGKSVIPSIRKIERH